LEAGYSNDSLGFAAGTFDRGCDNCEAENAVVIGGAPSKALALGARYSQYQTTKWYGAGLIIGADGEHRLGLNADMEDPEGANNNTNNHGAGYAYVQKEHTIAIELSQQAYENTATPPNNIKILSVSYQRRAGPLAASLSYEKRLEDPAENNDEFWMGAGFNSTNWHLGVYAQYYDEIFAVLSAYF
ncbi:MAG TPA: hypothetical protein VFV50_15810, partial [Bdellovibrionales bacterium]|nr:hypothetical protein [Bdellovibrionales bacterium]